MRCHVIGCWAFLGLVGLAARAVAEEPRPKDKAATEPPAQALVQRLWAVSDLVLEHDVDPPARQEMMLGGLRALLRKTGAPAPADLGRRVSNLTKANEFVALFQEFWPQQSAKAPAAHELETAVLEGLLARVPGRPQWIPPAELKVLEQIQDNRYVGTGIQISMHAKEKRAQIIDPFRGGPARRAGAKPGDLILEVDGKSTEGVNIRGVVDMIRGDEGTPVTFVVRQPGETETRTLKMVRGVVPFESVLGLKRGGDDAWVFRVQPDAPVAYLQLASVTSSTVNELRRVEQSLQAAGFKALVLDLRQAGGDSVQQAALLADSLLDGGVLWQVRDAQGRVKEYRADRDCLFRDWPLAVLVDEFTGPAAGWVAEALRNNRRAVLVGDTPRGSRSYVSTRVPLPDSLGAVVLHTGVLLWPNAKPAAAAESGEAGKDLPMDRELAEVARGVVKPDHVVKTDPKQRDALMKWFAVKNRSLLPEEGPRDHPTDDPQLAKAVALLGQALGKGPGGANPADAKGDRP